FGPHHHFRFPAAARHHGVAGARFAHGTGHPGRRGAENRPCRRQAGARRDRVLSHQVAEAQQGKSRSEGRQLWLWLRLWLRLWELTVPLSVAQITASASLSPRPTPRRRGDAVRSCAACICALLALGATSAAAQVFKLTETISVLETLTN